MQNENNQKVSHATNKSPFMATIRAVFWSFFGVRKQSDYEQDAKQLNPVHVIIAGLLATALFIFTLLTIIGFVVSK